MKALHTTLFIRLLCLAVIGSLCGALYAQKEYAIRDVPNVQLRDRTQFVSDPEGIVADSAKQEINSVIAHIRDSLGVQTAVVVLPAIDSEYSSSKEFATKLLGTWGIGEKGKDNGLLILLITGGGTGSRRIEMETGYGLEEVLPDALCKIIQTERMVPLLKEEKWGEGLLAGVQEVQKILLGTTDLPTTPQAIAAFNEQKASEEEEDNTIGAFLGFIFVVVIIVVVVRSFKGSGGSGSSGGSSYRSHRSSSGGSSWGGSSGGSWGGGRSGGGGAGTSF